MLGPSTSMTAFNTAGSPILRRGGPPSPLARPTQERRRELPANPGLSTPPRWRFVDLSSGDLGRGHASLPMASICPVRGSMFCVHRRLVT
jgi:hypothetical protein